MVRVGSHGIEVERRLREIAAHHGVPDFVFRPVDVPKGNAKREVGDFILWVGDAVAIVSSKTRDPQAAACESAQRRRRWLKSHIEDAYRSIQGVGDTLRDAEPDKIILESERGVRVPWRPEAIAGYIGVVLATAPPPHEDYAPPVMNGAVPTIAMLGDDWDLLNRLLPSTASLIRYVARRQQLIPACPLGAEADVLALILEHENTGEPITTPDDGLPKDHFELVAAAHPDWFLGADPEDRFAFVINAMIEGAADADTELSDAADPLAYMRIVEFLDRIPLLIRVGVGRAVVEQCERVGRDGGRAGSLFAVPSGLMVFVTDDGDRTARIDHLRALTLARHSQALGAGAPAGLVTVGIGTPSTARTHDYVLIGGGVRSDPVFRAERDGLFGAPEWKPMIEYWRHN